MEATRKKFLNNLWKWKCGLEEKEMTKRPDPKLIVELRKTEWSPEFEQLMRNRLVFGAVRYGRMGHGAVPKGKPTYDRCESIRKRLSRFECTGNAEWLVDIANLALLIYEERVHPDFHFKAIDDEDEDAYHDKILK